jgi:hypothetical protein
MLLGPFDDRARGDEQLLNFYLYRVPSETTGLTNLRNRGRAAPN